MSVAAVAPTCSFVTLRFTSTSRAMLSAPTACCAAKHDVHNCASTELIATQAAMSNCSCGHSLSCVLVCSLWLTGRNLSANHGPNDGSSLSVPSTALELLPVINLRAMDTEPNNSVCTASSPFAAACRGPCTETVNRLSSRQFTVFRVFARVVEVRHG